MVGFSPVTVKDSPVASSLGKNLTGSPRVARDIIADVYNTIQKWNDLNIVGTKIVQEIAGIKSNKPNAYSDKLDFLTRELYKLVQRCCLICEEISMYYERMESLTKLHKQEDSLFISLSVEKLADIIKVIKDAYFMELEKKQLVLEDIAHSKCDNEAMFFAALWTYQIDITTNVGVYLEALLTESGHRKII